MDGEFAGSQSCTGLGETQGKSFAADGLQAQACLPVDGILVKGNACTAKVGSYVWFRYGNRKQICGCAWNGRHAALRTQWKFFRVGSSPTIRTIWERSAMDSAADFYSAGCRFKSCRSLQIREYSSMAERPAVNRQAAGSSPAIPARYGA